MDDEAGITHEFWEINGIKMHVALAGSGPPIILLHGFPEIWYSWRRLIPLLAGNFRVIACDLRGYGKTEVTRGGYDIETLGRDALGLIERAGEPAILVGHDWGGLVGWQAASAYPDRVKAYITVAGPHPARYFELLFRNFRQLLMSYYVFVFQVPWLPERFLSANHGRMAARIMKGSALRKGSITSEDLEIYAQTWTSENMRAGINYYRSLARRPFWTLRYYREHKVKCPVCVVWAARDFALSLAQTEGLERWCEIPPEVHVIPDCGHWISQEAPEELHNIMMDFLSGKVQSP